MATHPTYRLKDEMRRLADKLYELVDLYKEDDAKSALAAVREVRMLAALGYEVESGGKVGEAAGQALLSIAHRQKIAEAIGRRRSRQPVIVDVTPGGDNGDEPRHLDD
jgi:hypothetical protein